MFPELCIEIRLVVFLSHMFYILITVLYFFQCDKVNEFYLLSRISAVAVLSVYLI